jgi:hypothetical protein
VVHFVTDKDGYRINAESENTKNSNVEKEYSVLFIGDSFLEAIQVENRLTIPQAMRETLAAQYPDVSISVTNSSVGGWNPNHYYLEAQRLSPKQYNLAIVFYTLPTMSSVKRFNDFPPNKYMCTV